MRRATVVVVLEATAAESAGFATAAPTEAERRSTTIRRDVADVDDAECAADTSGRRMRGTSVRGESLLDGSGDAASSAVTVAAGAVMMVMVAMSVV